MLINVIRSVFFYLILVITFFLGTTITLCIIPFFGNKHRPFQVAARLWAKLLIFCSRIPLQISGLENIAKNQTYLIASNHQGAADILIVLAGLPINFLFAIKQELFNIPVFGWYLKKAGYIPVDRALILSAYKLVDNFAQHLTAGESILVFPEGTRTKTGELGAFKRGSLLSAPKANVPVLPVAISGSFHLMPKGSKIIVPHPVKMTIGEPIAIGPDDDYEKKVAEVHSTIQSMLQISS
ncbi:MAG: lysophospholipid acyltransferase family protein [Candidatus Margulisbacteria bacterium]|nr:lysophospholipid acyltransferase family protein [Candidatus Margulisiibacteriota bacterium]